MTRTRRLVIFTVLACVCAALSLYAYAYTHQQRIYSLILSAQSTPNPAAAPASVPDGSYTLQIHSILTAHDQTSLTLTHVNYFDGGTATSSAEHEAHCPKEQPLGACVPTLVKGYYVRPSGAQDFSAPLTPDSRIVLHDIIDATVDSLKNLHRQFDPVFDVTIDRGVISALIEKSPL
jgi:hypothetical protein